MEAELAHHLDLLLAAYREQIDRQPSTLGRLAADDGKFFERIRDGATFTVKKYDAVVSWFSVNWPDGAVWPADVPRPTIEASLT